MIKGSTRRDSSLSEVPGEREEGMTGIKVYSKEVNKPLVSNVQYILNVTFAV